MLALGAITTVLRAQFTDFTTLGLEELSLVSTTTLGRTENTLVDYPAAATVLSTEDIVRSGATTLPETLRGVPGMQIGRADTFNYAISVRGFNDNSANKLLVVSDGRSLLDGTFSGTNWGMHDLILGDLERIEVLRGPGASLWGANAMNGFINIVSKSAFDTLGSHAAVAVGKNQLELAELRYGAKLGDQTAIRWYAKAQHQESAPGTRPFIGTHRWDTRLIGSRLDHRVDDKRRLTVIAEWRDLDTTGLASLPQFTPPYRRAFTESRAALSTNLSARWQQPLPIWEGKLEAFASVDHVRDNRDSLRETRDTALIDLQAKLKPLPGHEVLTGLTYRRTEDELSSNGIFSFQQPQAAVVFFGGFLQDEFELIRDRLRVSAGTKIERNSYSGWEFQPSLRAIWAPHAQHRVWAAYSKAARTPSRAENGVDYFGFVEPANPPAIPLPIAVNVRGSEDFSSEHLEAFELGYRFAPEPRLQVEATVFFNEYSDVRGFTNSAVTPVLNAPIPYFDIDVLTVNTVSGHTTGGEFNVSWHASPTLHLGASHSWIDHDLRDNAATTTEATQFSLDLYTISSPARITRGELNWKPHDDLAIDLAIQHADSLEAGRIPAYTGLHARLAWRPRPDWQVELIGRDLLESIHREYPDPITRDTEANLSRSLFLRVTFSR